MASKLGQTSRISINRISLGLVLLAMVVATWLRISNTAQLTILTPAAGQELLLAAEALSTRTLLWSGLDLAWTGVSQTPLGLWLVMVMQIVAGPSTSKIGLLAGLLSLAGIIFWYELLVTNLNRTTAVTATWLMAVSPLGIAQARMPLALAGIPLVLGLVYWTHLRLAKHSSWGLFWAILAVMAAVQLEITLAGLSLLTFVTWWRYTKPATPSGFKQAGISAGAALVVGSFPQWIWFIVNGVSSFSLTTLFAEKIFSVNQLLVAISQLFVSWSKVVSLDHFWVSILLLGFGVLSTAVLLPKIWNRQVSILIELVVSSWLIQTCTLILTGPNHEGAFSIFIVIWPVLIGYGVSQLPVRAKHAAGSLILGLCLVTAWQIHVRQPFFGSVDTWYGVQLTEQQEIVQYLNETAGPHFQLITTTQNSNHTFQNLAWLQYTAGYPPVTNPDTIFAVEATPTLNSYPNSKKVIIGSTYVYQLF